MTTGVRILSMAEGSGRRGSAKVLLGKTIIGHAHYTGVSDDDGRHDGEVIVNISQSTCLLAPTGALIVIVVYYTSKAGHFLRI